MTQYDQYEIEKWIETNPMEADCREDLANWVCEEFDISDEDSRKVWDLVRDLHPNMQK